jgi:hypothetical protein
MTMARAREALMRVTMMMARAREVLPVPGKCDNDDSKSKGGKGDSDDEKEDSLTHLLSFALHRFMVSCSGKGDDDGKGNGGSAGRKGDDDDDHGRQ